MDEQDIFLVALDKATSSERTAYLNEACGGNAVLLRRIEGLLQRHDDAGSFLERPPVELDWSSDMPSVAREEGDARQDDGRTVAGGHTQDAQLDFLRPSNKPDCLGTIGQYEINSIIGRGGMGLVFMAHDTKLLRTVAVKVLAPELAANAGAKQRFLREARAAAAVTHPHVVTIHAVDEDRVPYLVMEMVDGITLRQKLDAAGMLEVKEILRIGSQIAHGLAAAHRQGLIHRDVKPANILLENGVERVKITDFGLARAINDVNITRTGEVSGTPQYMSPEQAQGVPVDHRSDLFSLGSVIYTMCSGRPPFRGDNAIAVIRRVVDDTPRPIREINDEIPEWLCEIVDKLLQKRPDDRYQTAAEVAALLEQHLSQLQHGASTPVVAAISSSVKKSGQSGDSGASQRWVSRGTWPKIIGPIAAVAAVALVAVIGIKITNRNGATVENKAPETVSPADGAAHANAPFIEAVKQALPQAPITSADPDRHAAEWVLSIGGNLHITEDGKERPVGVASDLPQGVFELTGLNLSKNQSVSDAGLAHLEDCKNLRTLVLDRTKVSDEGLAHFKDCKNLAILGVGGTIVGDAGLAHLKDCKNLIGLWLYSTRVTDAGLAETVKELPNLKTLHLTYTRVTDAGLAHLKDYNRDLTAVILSGCKVSDAGLEYLAGCPKLNSVIAENTQVTEAGVKKLSAALSRCTIRWDGGESGPK